MGVKYMRKVKFSKATCTMLLSCTIATTSLTGCMKESSDIEYGTVINVENSQNLMNKNDWIDDWVNRDFESIAQELSEETGLSVVYSKEYINSSPGVCILGSIQHDKNNELSDEFYTKLNFLIKNGNSKTLLFNHLGDSFDFSKIDFSNIEYLTFQDCEGSVDLSKSSQKYESISFENTSLGIAMGILSSCDVSETYVYWGESVEDMSDLKPLLKYLVEKDISMGTLCVQELNRRDYTGITEEEFQLLGKVNTSLLQVRADGFQEPLNLDLTLHENMKNLYIDAYHTFSSSDSINGELGSIKINSDHEIYCVFANADITESTSFSLPDASCITLESLNCKDMSAFQDLKNVQYLSFDRKIEGEDPIIYFTNPKYFTGDQEVYGNFDRALEEIENRYGTAKDGGKAYEKK